MGERNVATAGELWPESHQVFHDLGYKYYVSNLPSEDENGNTRLNFIRPLQRGTRYPRFHFWVASTARRIRFGNIHIDDHPHSTNISEGSQAKIDEELRRIREYLDSDPSAQANFLKTLLPKSSATMKSRKKISTIRQFTGEGETETESDQ